MISTPKDDGDRIVKVGDLADDPSQVETKWACPICAGKCQACDGAAMLTPSDYKTWKAALKAHRKAAKP